MGDAPRLDTEERPNPDEEARDGQLVMGERPLFLHPQWTVGVVLVLAVVTLLLGIVGHPVWLLIGSPFILTLGIWLWVRIHERRNRKKPGVDPER